MGGRICHYVIILLKSLPESNATCANISKIDIKQSMLHMCRVCCTCVISSKIIIIAVMTNLKIFDVGGGPETSIPTGVV